MVALGLLVLNLLFGHSTPTMSADGPGPVVQSPPDAFPTEGSVPSTSTPSDTPPDPATTAPSAEPAFERPPLTVYNHSRVTGLAKKAAADFTRGGWEVVEVTNTRYPVGETTVFFAPGQEAAAAALRAQFPAVRRAAPRPAGLQGSGLTVVVTRDYPH